MPILNLTLSGTPDPALSARAAATLSDITAKILHKSASHTSITVGYHPADHWFVAGASLDAQSKTSFFLDILVSAESNTNREKAAYISAVFTAMGTLLGELHPISYVHVHDASPGTWGYSGAIQKHRFVAATI
ncbi:MAG: 4-oxalocrotonate tautomerase [Pseudomonadota bacterium]